MIRRALAARSSAQITAGASRRLGWSFVLLAGIFPLALLIFSVLERLGLPYTVLAVLVAAVPVILGLRACTMLVGEFYLAGRRVPAPANGTIAAQWLSGALVIGLVGVIYTSGSSSASGAMGLDVWLYVVGWCSGLVLLALLLAPYLNRSGALTVPDFLAARYGGKIVRLLALAVLVATSFLLLSAQLVATGFVASRFLGFSHEIAIVTVLAIMLVCTLAGGMRALTWAAERTLSRDCRRPTDPACRVLLPHIRSADPAGGARLRHCRSAHRTCWVARRPSCRRSQYPALA
ncbi:hypothetical protein [Breoghania sp.]|uniref:sodium:solute symporter family transporter n=1 Tax=Breoghania sp. TaxID=2065378 RepID=UPI002626E581|nr:hypothetical protein [Breoghania sp.]MDJ0933461.1 hypothetical protein [Breoghania sp.]